MADAPLEAVKPNHRLWRDLSLLRISGALLVAALSPATALCIIALIGGADFSAAEDQGALLFGYPTSLVWLGICAGGHLGLIRLLGYVTRRQCLVWGFVSGLLALVTHIAVSYAADPDPAHYWDEALVPMLVLAALLISAGLLSGWIYWRLGFRPPSAPAPARSSVARAAGPGRKLAGIVLAAAATAVPMLLAVMTEPNALLLSRIIIVCLGAICVWLIGGTAYVCLRRSSLRMAECLVLGMFLGSLVPAATFLLAGLMRHFTEAGSPSVMAPLHIAGLPTIVRTGLIELPFGLLGGWLLGRNAATPVANALSDRQPLIERRWQDLRKWRLLFAMILAAAVPIVLFAILSILSFGPISDQYFSAAGFGSALVIFELWFLAFGIPYLFGIRWRRGTVRRRDCLFLGSLVYCCFPVFLATLQGRFGLPEASWIDAQTGVVGIILLIAVLGFIFLPFGLLSGWILWRVGVRPAKPEEIGVAPVFD